MVDPSVIERVRPYHCLKDIDAELPWILARFSATGARRCLEIGTYKGATSAAIGLAFPEAEIHTVDLPDPRTSKYNPLRRSRTGAAHRDLGVDVIQHWMDSADLWRLLPRTFDFVFVDGSHDEDVVFRDLVLGCDLLRPNGAIICHDYTDSRDEERPPWTQQVQRAVDRFRLIRPFSLERGPVWLAQFRRTSC